MIRLETQDASGTTVLLAAVAVYFNVMVEHSVPVSVSPLIRSYALSTRLQPS